MALATDSQLVLQSNKKIEALEQKARDLAWFVETTRQQTLLQSDKKIEDLEQRARDLAHSVESIQNQTRLQSDTEIESLGEKARDLAILVEAVRTETRRESECEIAFLGQQARDLAASVEAIREETLLHTDTEIASLGQQARDLAVSVESAREETLLQSDTEIQALKQHLRSARLLAEQTQRQSEELMRNVFDGASIAMLVTDLEGRFVRVNQAVVELLGYSQAEMLKLVANDVTHPDDLAETQLRMGALLAGAVRFFRLEKRFIHKDGRVLWGLAHISLVHDANGNPLHIVGQVQDITERIATEKALCESREKSDSLEEQFRQSQKMEAVGQLAAGVAHDFNNLLTVVVGYSEILLHTMDADDASREPIEEIRKAGDRAAGLTRQLLAFGRKQILAPVVVDLNVQLMEIERMLRRLIGADIDLTTKLEPGLGSVLVDVGQVEQILMNLVINARDAMPAGGRITIRTQNAVPSELQVRQDADLPPGPYTVLAVSDTGCGMTEATKARIFEPFFTTKDIGKGTGLGLATVFGIVRQSGGFIEVDSAPDRGSTFRIFLPQVLKAMPTQQGSQVLASAPKVGGETILLVEDEDALRNLTKMVLRSSGYNVLSTRHGGEALQVCHEHVGDIHLLFTDVVMPKMSGRQLADLLIPFRPTMKLLYMSGYTDDTMVRHGIREGTNFLAKPFTPVALAQKIRDVLDGTQRR